MVRKSQFSDKGKPQQSRRVAERETKPRLLILCGGEQTERNYFQRFRVNADIDVIGIGKDPRTLIQEAKKKKDHARRQGQPYNEIWIVFDRDDFTSEDFNAVIQMAETANFCTAWSNEAFELWYVLHFSYVDSSLGREQYSEQLNRFLKNPYKKNSLIMYEELSSRQYNAFVNAKRLFESQKDAPPASANPCTTVFQLVERLNELQ